MLGIHRIQLRGLNAIIDFVLFIGHWDFGRYIKVYRYLLCGRNTRNILNIRMKTASIIMVSIELHCIMSCYHGVTEYCIVSSCFLFFFVKHPRIFDYTSVTMNTEFDWSQITYPRTSGTILNETY